MPSKLPLIESGQLQVFYEVMQSNEPTDKTRKNEFEKIADESGLAIVAASENAFVSEANNNSICARLYASEEFAPRCDEFCGRAFELARAAGEIVAYQCYAGLDCLAVPLKTEQPLVAIVGRAFTKAENYRRATERAISGDWNKFPPTKFFENVLINGSSKNLEATAKRVGLLSEEDFEKESGNEPEAQKSVEEPQAINDEQISKPETSSNVIVSEEISRWQREDADENAAWRALFNSLFALSYEEACRAIFAFLAKRYALGSMAWLERRENRFEGILASGFLENREFKINLPANDQMLFDALERELSLDMRERAEDGATENLQTISLFPVAIGSEIQTALVVSGNLADEELKRRIFRFCRAVAPELEILRLREEVRRRNRLAETIGKFNKDLKNLDAEDFWANLMRFSAELLQAERSSLLVFDEKSDSLTVKAAIGATADLITNKSAHIGERVARIVLRNGEPVVVENIKKIGLPPAPPDWKYKSDSFISFPFVIGERRVGILNLTDKADGAAYTESDLEVLHSIAPQVAVMIDRAVLKNKAGEFEQLSVTDALTGLLNRRYLEERLAEEIKRSNRYGYPMCFMMIDVDNFKSFNDNFGHAEGDKALKIVAQVLRETLRGADIAARFGGEEFSILLPQTTLTEAATIAERLRENIENTEFPNRQVTISIGIANCCLELNSAQHLIVAADNALYAAKRAGRNNVQIYEKIREAVNLEKK